MILLTVNTGSSSVRLAAFSEKAGKLKQECSAHIRGSEGPADDLLGSFIHEHDLKDISVVAHRVVHGGSGLTASCVIDEKVEAEIDRLSILAPLHNPVALQWIRTCRQRLGSNIPHIAVFDTAFYAHLPEVASAYALPGELSRRHEIRKYGFHGLAHSAMLGRWITLRPDLDKGGRVISLQLGAGCSITAVKSGRAVDTSMGFSPLEGLVMATRSGDLDPGLVTYLIRSGYSAEDLEQVLNHDSGLLGISGISGDMGRLLESERPEARLAIDLYCYRIRKYVGAYLAVLEGADALLFGGGVGENAPEIRKRILEPMSWCGFEVDAGANSATIGIEGCISPATGKIDVRVIPVNEAEQLAEEAVKVIRTQ